MVTKSQIQEALVTLYLRLNGYFTSGFIVHSPIHGENRTELDVLAVRLPHNSESAREIGGAPELDRWDGGHDFIIGEVKSHGERIQFNQALRTPEAVSAVLNWWGHLTKNEVADLVDSVIGILQPLPGGDVAPTVQCPRDSRIRAILFSPETNQRRQNQSWFIPGPPMMDYIWECLRASVPRLECATVYDFGSWGTELEPLIKYFKTNERQNAGSFSDLLKYLGVAND